jgi:hypothetical protein
MKQPHTEQFPVANNLGQPLQVFTLLSYKAIVTLSVGLPFTFFTKSINKLILIIFS